MTQYLQTLLDGATLPVATAFLLGLLTALSPCPLAANIAAVGYISKDAGNRRRVFLNGLLYTLGRIASYSLLGAVLIALLRSGSELFAVQKTLSRWGEMLLPPALILFGLFLLFGHRLRLPAFGFRGGKRLKGRGGCDALLLGILFSLAFCPTSGLLFFGMLIPLSAAHAEGYLLPGVYAVGTGLPVIAAAWIVAYGIAGLGTFYGRMRVVQRWLTRIVALLFLAAGLCLGIFCYL